MTSTDCDTTNKSTPVLGGSLVQPPPTPRCSSYRVPSTVPPGAPSILAPPPGCTSAGVAISRMCAIAKPDAPTLAFCQPPLESKGASAPVTPERRTSLRLHGSTALMVAAMSTSGSDAARTSTAVTEIPRKEKKRKPSAFAAGRGYGEKSPNPIVVNVTMVK